MKVSINNNITITIMKRWEAIKAEAIICIQSAQTWEEEENSKWIKEAVTFRETLKKKWEINIVWRLQDRLRLQSRFRRITLWMTKWATGRISRVSRSRLLKNSLCKTKATMKLWITLKMRKMQLKTQLFRLMRTIFWCNMSFYFSNLTLKSKSCWAEIRN